jgi:hypothetical protein
MRDRNVILYGNADTNAAWKTLLKDSPLKVRRGSVQVGSEEERTGDDLACLFVYPKSGTERALVGVVGGTGPAGFRLTDRLPYFLSGVAFPDWVIASPDTLHASDRGVVGAGFFGNDWQIPTGEAAWKDAAPTAAVR